MAAPRDNAEHEENADDGRSEEHFPHGARVASWERRVEIPMLLLAGAFLVAYAWPVIDQDLGGDLRSSLRVLTWTVWVAFAVDFWIRLSLAEHRVRYAAKHWYDVVLIVLPMFRALRLLRLLALMRMLNRSMAGTLSGRASVYVAGTAALTSVLGAIAVLDVEQHAPGANITEFGDALWWSVVTVTTVGYGDFYPITFQGRLVAVALMIMGISLVGVLTAAVASAFVSNIQQQASKDAEAAKSTQES
ncbi:voltage-gated potassium channel [Nocardiopsis sp. Huas11]|uniref:potassium channel family protein n=1 Tax=Nocardiopsis sp. Huas11 TaxID=2183912 RepID=UPI000F0EDCDC|nr:potassium channel family protein [Nocardiopsis sp. Huas11]RKS08908.1 voltage-gated potassium channel [Nocardiopsis sp. Huas11]